MLYSKLVSLSREKFLYKDLKISDTFASRTYLIFFYTSFLLVKLKNTNDSNKKLSQNIFDYVFLQIETNLRELGLGDVTVNKKMKNLTKVFYEILENCDKFETITNNDKLILLRRFFYEKNTLLDDKSSSLSQYLERFRVYAMNLSINNIQKGDINFTN